MLGRQDGYDRYLRREVRAHSPYWRRAGAAVEPRPLGDFAELAPALVLRPEVGSIYADGARRLALRTLWARLWGGQQRVNDRVLVPRYKPVLWVKAGDMPIGYSADDVQRLGRIGAQWFRLSGVVDADVLVNVLAAGPDLAWWQVVYGARAAGLSAMHLGSDASADDVARLEPSVVVGRTAELRRALRPGPRLVLVVGERLRDDVRVELSELAGGALVLCAWAPPGVRALWGECAGGAATGLHTWPGDERIELFDMPAEVVWSPMGWRGTVLLRLKTGLNLAAMHVEPCPACGHDGPRLFPLDPLAALDDEPAVLEWRAERRVVDGAEELIVHLAVDPDVELEPLLRRLDAHLHATQFVVAT